MIHGKGHISQDDDVFELQEILDLSIVESVNMYIKSGLSSMDAIKRVSRERGIPKGEVYKEYQGGKM